MIREQKSGRGLPHSKTFGASCACIIAKRLGVRQSSAAFASQTLLGFFLFWLPVTAAEKTEYFDRDPNWEGHNNRTTNQPPREVRQDFGFSNSSHCGGDPGEIGGLICPAAEPAWYGKPIGTRSFNDRLTASGKLNCE